MKTLLKLIASNRRCSLSILADTVLFDGATARATDLETTVVCNGAWNFDTPRIVSVSLIKSAMALAASSKQVWAGTTLNGIELVAAPGYQVADYPSMMADGKIFSGARLHFTRHGDLAASVKRTLPAAGVAGSRYHLNGLCFDLANGAIVSTDGHRAHIDNAAFTPCTVVTYVAKMTVAGVTTESEKIASECIVPRAVFELCAKPEFIELSATHAKIFYACGYILSKLIEGRFPEYKRIVPDTKNLPVRLHINGAQNEAIGKIVAVNKANKSKFGQGILAPDGTVRTLSGISLPFSGAWVGVETSFNAKHIADAFKAADHGELYLAGDSTSSCMFKSGNFTAVVMPCRA